MKSNKSKRKYIIAKLNYYDFVKTILISVLHSRIRIPNFSRNTVKIVEENEMPTLPQFKDLEFHLRNVRKIGYLWWKKKVAYYEFIDKV